MVISNELKPGNYFTYEGNIYVVLETLHNKTAMAKMVIKIKAKKLHIIQRSKFNIIII